MQVIRQRGALSVVGLILPNLVPTIGNPVEWVPIRSGNVRLGLQKDSLRPFHRVRDRICRPRLSAHVSGAALVGGLVRRLVLLGLKAKSGR